MEVQKVAEKPSETAPSKKKRSRGGKRGGVKHRKRLDSADSTSKLGNKVSKTVSKKTNNNSNNKSSSINNNSSNNINSKKSQLVDRFKGKAEVIAANQQISHHAQRKQLSLAIECFDTLRQSGDANTHSYAAVIFAYVKCGDVKGAHVKLNEMKSSGLRPCVVCYTSLLKGLCDGKGRD